MCCGAGCTSRATGTPRCAAPTWAKLAKQVKAHGITKVSGSLFVDTSYFEARQYNPGWSTSYADDYYAAPISALTLAPNADYDSGTVLINYTPGRTGRKAKITTTPAAARKYVKIANRTTTSSSWHLDHCLGLAQLRQQHHHRPRAGAARPLREQVDHRAPAGAVRGGRVPRRTGQAQDHHRGLDQARGHAPRGAQQLVARDRSMPLTDLLIPFMKLSNNMHAEALTKAMSRQDRWCRQLGRTAWR